MSDRIQFQVLPLTLQNKQWDLFPLRYYQDSMRFLTRTHFKNLFNIRKRINKAIVGPNLYSSSDMHAFYIMIGKINTINGSTSMENHIRISFNIYTWILGIS